MGYFNMSVHVDQDVDVELDTDDVLGNMDLSDILDYVSSNICVENVLAYLNTDEVRTCVIGKMDNTDILNGMAMHEVAEYLVQRRTGLAAVLRYVADKLDEQESIHN